MLVVTHDIKCCYFADSKAAEYVDDFVRVLNLFATDGGDHIAAF